MVARPFLGVLLLAAAGCVDPLTTHATSAPAWEANNVAGYAETATGAPPDVEYGRDFRIEAGVARWRECATADACGSVQRERPAGDVLAVERLDGDVVKLSLAPRAKYVVPYDRPAGGR